ncbi:22089_t:CDS:2, partial [Racocetra persica]
MLPSLQILGLWRGAPYVELSGTSVIQSQNFNTVIEFTGKGWISGEKHTFSSVVRRNGSKDPLFTASGTWSGKSTLVNHMTNEKSVFLDVGAKHRATPIIEPIEKQNDLESIKLWQHVSKAINEGDFSTASKLKGEIEQRQRDKVKRGEATVLQYFDWMEEDEEFLSLYNLIGSKLNLENKHKEKGSW